jgi:polysaccharide chain length determinant protein (PEP-CTERM system associated)
VAKAFLEQQINEQKTRLATAESRIAEFKREHADLLPEQGANYFQRLQNAQAAVDDVDLQITEAEYRRSALQEQLEDTPQTLQGTSTDTRTVITATGSRVAVLQERLDELLLKYTEKHPDVIATRRSLEEIKRQGEMTRSEKVSGPPVPNPVYQQLKVTLGQVESEISALRVRRQVYSRRVQSLQERREPLTQVEAELQSLNQDYDLAKQKFDALVARQGPANMAGNVEEAGEDVRFRIIDPARVQETWPEVAQNRLVLTTMVLAAGVGGGLGIAFLLSQLWPTIYGRRALNELTGLPVYGVISQAKMTRGRWRKKLDYAVFVLIAATLLSVHGTALFMELAKHKEILRGIGGVG